MSHYTFGRVQAELPCVGQLRYHSDSTTGRRLVRSHPSLPDAVHGRLLNADYCPWSCGSFQANPALPEK